MSLVRNFLARFASSENFAILRYPRREPEQVQNAGEHKQHKERSVNAAVKAVGRHSDMIGQSEEKEGHTKRKVTAHGRENSSEA